MHRAVRVALNKINVTSGVANLNHRASFMQCLPHTKYIAYPHYTSCLTYALEQRTLCLTGTGKENLCSN